MGELGKTDSVLKAISDRLTNQPTNKSTGGPTDQRTDEPTKLLIGLRARLKKQDNQETPPHHSTPNSVNFVAKSRHQLCHQLCRKLRR